MASDYLFHPTGARRAPWLVTQTGPPPDAGLPQPIVAPSWPDRAKGPLRAAVICYVALLSATPRDAGLAQPIVGPPCPDRAPRAQRAAPSAYDVLLSATPRDAGLTVAPTPVFLPDRAPGPRRTAATAYDGGDPLTPQDAGTLPIWSSWPDRAPTARRTAASAYDGGNPLTPQDAGTLPVPASWPDRAPPARRAAASAYDGGNPPTPQDVGTLPIPPSWPDRAPGPVRAGRTAYDLSTAPAPPDQGIVPAPPAVAAAWPDIARGAARTAAVAYAGLVSATPPDSGIAPLVSYVDPTAVTTLPAGTTADVDPAAVTLPAIVPAAWAYAGNQAGTNTVAFTATITLPNPVVVGDVIAVGAVTWKGSPPLTSAQVSVADNKGNTYSLARWENNANTGNMATGIFWTRAMTGGSGLAVTLTSTASTFLTLMGGEFAPPAGAAGVLVDAAGSAVGSGTAPAAGGLGVGGVDFAFGVVNTVSNVAFTAAGGFTLLNSQNTGANESGSTIYRLNPVGAVVPSWTLGGSSDWQAVGATFTVPFVADADPAAVTVIDTPSSDAGIDPTQVTIIK